MPKIPHSPIRMYFLLQPPGSNGNNQTESECKACGLRMKVSNCVAHVGYYFANERFFSSNPYYDSRAIMHRTWNDTFAVLIPKFMKNISK